MLNKYQQDQMSETKKTWTKKHFAIINGVPENLLPEYSLGPEKPKFWRQVFSPSKVIIHELFKPMTSSKLLQKEILYQVWRKSKTPTGWIQSLHVYTCSICNLKKKISDTVAAILILFSLRLAHHVPPSREDADMEDVCGIITCGLIHKFSK